VYFSDLTPEDEAWVANGCGGKGGWFDPPDFIWKARCQLHDFRYWKGGTYLDRLKVDQDFLRGMLWDARHINTLRIWPDLSERTQLRRPLRQRMLYVPLAWVYYIAVRIFGGRYFAFGRPKVYIDLLLLRAAVRDQKERERLAEIRFLEFERDLRDDTARALAARLDAQLTRLGNE
jgi:hypothetical protein